MRALAAKALRCEHPGSIRELLAAVNDEIGVERLASPAGLSHTRADRKQEFAAAGT
jgi:hypothetical protein